LKKEIWIMKRVLILGALISAATGCASPEIPIRILNGHAWSSTDCALEELVTTRGSFDVATPSSYFLGFDIENDLQQISTQVGDDIIADASRNNFITRQVVLTYTSTPALPFEEERYGKHYVVPPGSDGSNVSVELLGPKAKELLRNNLAGGSSDSYEVTTSFWIEGDTAAGLKVKTNTVNFPIRAYRSSVTCPAGDFVPSGPCGSPGGQDGAPLACCSDPAWATSDFCT
jgi:hypothetical protein